MKFRKTDIAAESLSPHSVTVYFVGIGLGTLRADMEAHAAGRGMIQRLCNKIRAYQLCMLDDPVAEAVHNHIGLHRPACIGGPVQCDLISTSTLRLPSLAGT